eukprot:s57_g62.t1
MQLSHVELQGFDRGHMDRDVLRKLRVLWVLPVLLVLLLSCDLFDLGYQRNASWALESSEGLQRRGLVYVQTAT